MISNGKSFSDPFLLDDRYTPLLNLEDIIKEIIEAVFLDGRTDIFISYKYKLTKKSQPKQDQMAPTTQHN